MSPQGSVARGAPPPAPAPAPAALRVAVIGAGAVGASFGAALQRAGHAVTFVARGRQLAALQARGLRITGARGDYHLAAVRATDRPDTVGPVDVVLLAVKLWDLAAVVPTLPALIAADSVVITLQNGIDAPPQAAAAVGAAHVAAGTCLVNAAIAAPGVIAQVSTALRIVAGMLESRRSEALGRFGAACASAGIEFEQATAPLDAMWEKFVQLVPISATTTLLGCPIGVVRGDRGYWRLFVRLMEETVQVGRATGANIPPAVVERRLAYIHAMPAEATSSMARDRLAGRRLELPWLSGRIVELGAHAGIATPANEFVVLALQSAVAGRAAAAAPRL